MESIKQKLDIINPAHIDVPFDKLKKVIHISDIHIRLLKRHGEYREVFDTLYSQVSTMIDEVEESVILVTGDILHAKTDLSPEMIALASEFLKKLADISPTLITVGNHDLNLSNSYRLDSLSPIIENISHSNLYYLKDSGVYTVADTDFAVYSLIGDRNDWPSVGQCKSPNKIALLHAPVNDAKTDTGYTITSRHVDVSTFNGYDMVMLGDIHKHQILQDYDGPSKYPLISYAGSLIQQNHGEKLSGHGLIEWDIPTRTLQHHEVPNKYGYATIIVEEGKVPDVSHIPEKARLRVFVKDLEISKVKKIEAILRKKFNLQEFIVNRMRDDQLMVAGESPAVLLDVQDTETQNELIEDYLKRHFVVDGELMTRIHELNVELNGRLVAADFTRNIQWTPLLFEFSNMFSYGEDNCIDFENIHGVHGLFSPNASGKTAAFDALMFCLYDKTPRAYKAAHIMNNRKDDFECTLKFDINGQEYGISRKGVRKKDRSVRVVVEFWKVEDGKNISLTGEDRRSTNGIIRRYVGTYEDLILTNISIQNNNALFIDKSQSERKDMLSQFIGSNVFDTLYQLSMEEMKESRGALKRMSKENYAITLVDLQVDIDKCVIEYDALEKTRKSVAWELSVVEAEITKLYESKTPLSVDNLNIADLESTKTDLMDSLKELLELSSEFETQKDELFAESGSQAGLVKGLDGIESTYEAAKSRHTELQLVDSKLDMLEERKFTFEAQLAHITEHEFDPDCDFCIRNNQSLAEQTEEIRASVKSDDSESVSLREKSENLSSSLILYDSLEIDFDLFKVASGLAQSAHSDLLSTVASISNLKAKVTSKKSKLKEVQANIKLYHRSIDVIEENALIGEKIDELEQRQQEFSDERRTLNTKSRGAHGKLQVHKSNKRKIIESISEMEDLEQQVQAYKLYVEAVKRNGIPYELISKVLPSIQAEINNILTQIADFTIVLEVDGKNINGKMVYDDDKHWPLEMASGMERFISSLAIRVALITISNLPKPNFLIIDEGIGTLSAENLPNMHTLFSILKNQFDFIIIISHLEAVRDMVDSLMEISLEDGFSKINY